jgi:Flp pilus assembly pilin Flp
MSFSFKTKTCRRGQALSEYLILTALIGVASIAVVQALSGNLRARLTVVSEALRGKKVEFKGIEASQRHYKTYDLGDFQDGITDTEEE